MLHLNITNTIICIYAATATTTTTTTTTTTPAPEPATTSRPAMHFAINETQFWRRHSELRHVVLIRYIRVLLRNLIN